MKWSSLSAWSLASIASISAFLETKAASAYSFDLAIWLCNFALIFVLRICNFVEPMNASSGRDYQAEKTIGIRDLELDFGAVVWMRVISNRELARLLGVSETAVRRAEKAGRIKREADGAWDLARVRAAWAGNTDPAQQRRVPSVRDGNRRVARRAVKPVPEAALAAVRETLREHGEPVATGQGP